MSESDKILTIFMALLLVSLIFASTTRGLGWDEAHHANAALFFSNLIKTMSDNPNFSFSFIKDYAIEYHSHYKFLTVAGAYPPLNLILLTTTYLLFGASMVTTKLVAIVEGILLVFFVYKLSGLFYRKHKSFPLLCAIFAGINPIIFLLSNSNFLAAGTALFVTASIYFLIKFIKTEERMYIYFFSIAFGLGLLQKPITGVVIIPLVFVFYRNFGMFRRQSYALLKSFILFLAVLSPLFIQISFLYALGFPDIFFDHWFRENPNTFLYIIPIMSELQIQNFLTILSSLFYQLFTIPFFILGAYKITKRRDIIDKVFILVMLSFVCIFIISSFMAETRYIKPILPLFTIIWVYGLILFFDRLRTICPGLVRRYRITSVIIVLLISVSLYQITVYNYDNTYYNNKNLDEIASFVISNASGSTTVLTSFGQPQTFEFARLDKDMNIFAMYMPQKSENIEYAVEGNYSYYKNYDLWKSLGIELPAADYIIFHEDVRDISYDYNNSYLLSRPGEFELIRVFENHKGDEVFVYRTKRNLNVTNEYTISGADGGGFMVIKDQFIWQCDQNSGHARKIWVKNGTIQCELSSGLGACSAAPIVESDFWYILSHTSGKYYKLDLIDCKKHSEYPEVINAAESAAPVGDGSVLIPEGDDIVRKWLVNDTKVCSEAFGGMIVGVIYVEEIDRAFIRSSNGNVSSMDMSCDVKWYASLNVTSESGYSSPVYDSDNNQVYVGECNPGRTAGEVYAIDASTGEVRWYDAEPGFCMVSTPAYHNDYLIVPWLDYSEPYEGKYSAYDSITGTKVWDSYAYAGSGWSSPIIVGRNLVYNTQKGVSPYYAVFRDMGTGQVVDHSQRCDGNPQCGTAVSSGGVVVVPCGAADEIIGLGVGSGVIGDFYPYHGDNGTGYDATTTSYDSSLRGLAESN